MEVKIGVQSVAREIVIETTMSPDEIQQALLSALSMDHGIFSLDDNRGGRVVVPVDKLGYIELSEQESRQVGFGSL